LRTQLGLTLQLIMECIVKVNVNDDFIIRLLHPSNEDFY
jgi:hypothetical protein